MTLPQYLDLTVASGEPSFGRSAISIGAHQFINQPFYVDASILTYPYFSNLMSMGPQLFMPSSSAAVKNIPLFQRSLQDFTINPFLGSTHSIDFETNDPKKTKLELNTNTEPSKVLHIRNIAPRAQEHDLTLLAVPFGKIKSMVYAKKTNQALIEMFHALEATRLFDYYQHYPPMFNGKEMIIQYSKHHGLELKLQNNSIDMSVHAANKMVDEHRQRVKELNSERRILRVVIENFKNYNINHLVILKVFQRFGNVLRIILFTKNMQYQCLIEMDNSISAHAALLHLNGQDVFTDSCRLRVEFSKNCDSLQVQRQNEKCRDYIVSPLLEEEQILLDSLDSEPKFISGNSSQQIPFPQNLSLLQSQFPNDLLGYSNLYFPFLGGAFGRSIHGQSTMFQETGALIQDSAISATMAEPLLKSSLPLTVDDYPIVMVTNIHYEKVSADALFTLFGVYGDVIRVTLSSIGSGSALIQMTNNQQADTACRFLNGIPLYGRTLVVVVISKDIIPHTIFNPDLNDTINVKDFANTPLHRFKKPNSKNHFNIYPPSSVLHLSNIPLSMLEEDLQTLFRNYGFTYTSVKIFQPTRKNKKMALANMSSLEQAICALIILHNCKLTDSSHLRVSFSKALI